MRKLLAPLFILQLIGLTAFAQLWKPMGQGLPGEVIQSTVNGRQLFVLYAGDFNEDGKQFGVGIWDGNIWRFLPEFTADSNARFRTMALYKDGLYIGGNHSRINGNRQSAYVFKWNGRSYEPVLENTPVYRRDFSVNKLLVYQGELIIGGSFTNIFSNSVKSMVRWNGRVFQPFFPVEKGLNGPVADLLVKQDTLFVAGGFDQFGDQESGGIVAFTDTQVARFYPDIDKVQRLIHNGTDLIYLEQEDKSFTFKSLHTDTDLMTGIDNIYFVQDMTTFDGRLWACGLFDNADEEKRFFQVFHNGRWQDVGNNDLNVVRELTVYRDMLIAAGNFQNFRNVPLGHIAILETEFGMLEGRVYLDFNSDCAFDRKDIAAPYWLLVANPGSYLIRANLLGEFRAFLPEGTYEIRPVIRKNLEVPPCIDAVQRIVVKKSESQSDLNFPIRLKPDIRDLKVELTSAQGFRAIREREQMYQLNYRNIGSLNSGPAKLELKFDKRLGFKQATPRPDSISEDKLVWLFSNINPGEDNSIDLIIEIPQALEAEQIQFEANISSQLGDDDPSDNDSELEQNISESEQFNSKQVFPEGGHPDDFTTIDPETEDIHYFINFGNFSNDTVKQVTIIDTIDLNLDLQYIQETGASHSYTTQLQSGPPGSNIGILIWHFDNINLRPNPSQISDLPGYSGYMSFKIGIKEGLAAGTKISNRAQIIYDYRSAFQTNEVICEMRELMHQYQGQETSQQLKIYPNPSNGVLHINHVELIHSVALFNQQGSLMRRISEVNQKDVSLNVSGYPTGIYFVSVTSSKGHCTSKLVIGMQ